MSCRIAPASIIIGSDKCDGESVCGYHVLCLVQDYLEYRNWRSEVKKIEFSEVWECCTISLQSDATIGYLVYIVFTYNS